MARNLNNVENETQTLFDLEYGDKTEIYERWEIYEEKTSPLVEYYKNKGVLRTEEISISINRMGKEVAEDILKDIKNK